MMLIMNVCIVAITTKPITIMFDTCYGVSLALLGTFIVFLVITSATCYNVMKAEAPSPIAMAEVSSSWTM